MRGVFRVSFFVGLFLFAFQTHAATLYIEPHEAELYPGDTLALSVRVDTDEDECINVIDGVLELSDNITPVDISLGESIFPLWVEQPTIHTETNTVSFAGGIPNGYCGRIDGDPRLTNVILELIVQASGLQTTQSDDDESDPTAYVTFGDATQVLLNNNAGTRAPLRTLDASIRVHKDPSGAIVNEWGERIDIDDIPPSKFSITLTSDPSIFGGRHFVAFNSTDKQSGIDHYEVMEEPIDDTGIFDWGAVNAPWVAARSPYLLQDQTLNSTIRIKAVDKAGNEYIAVYVPDESMRARRPFSTPEILLIVGAVLVMVVGGAFFFYRNRTRQYSNLDSDTISEPVDESDDQ